jgi:ferrous iron transport protein A
VTVGGDHDVRRRLLEMGFCNGATVEVIRRAPLGDPIEFRLRGYHLSLRDEQAKFVQITTI